MIDESTPLGALVARHLREDEVVWLTTVTASGAPFPSPVWFLWDGADGVLVFSLAGAGRLRNIEANPKVSLNFNGNAVGGDIVILAGRASVEPSGSAARVEAFARKYEAGLARLGITLEQFAARYSVPVRIHLTGVRGHP